MASVDCLLENGAMSTTAPGLILSTSPPGRKNAGAVAGALGYGQLGAIPNSPANSRKPVANAPAGVRAMANAPPAPIPTPRNAIPIRPAGRGLPTNRHRAHRAHANQM